MRLYVLIRWRRSPRSLFFSYTQYIDSDMKLLWVRIDIYRVRVKYNCSNDMIWYVALNARTLFLWPIAGATIYIRPLCCHSRDRVQVSTQRHESLRASHYSSKRDREKYHEVRNTIISYNKRLAKCVMNSCVQQ